jgi:hypothetical protein
MSLTLARLCGEWRLVSENFEARKRKIRSSNSDLSYSNCRLFYRGSKKSEESHRSKWKTKFLSMFLAVTYKHASGVCQSHSHPVLNLRKASRKYVELSPSTPPFLTLQFYEKDLTPTPNLLRISGQYSLHSGIFFQSPQGHSGDWVSQMIL